jgi:asparagine N-glycosylation enzyme membrane subunit Stt3
VSSAVVFIAGASAGLAGVASAFFVRFWRGTGDRFFLLFAGAFALFAVNRIGLISTDREHNVWIYVLRLAAFALIILAIVDKNRPRRGD